MEEQLKIMMGTAWFEFLKEEFRSPWFIEMATKIAQERANKMIYPASEDVFRAFRMTSPDDVKVVMLGQD